MSRNDTPASLPGNSGKKNSTAWNRWQALKESTARGGLTWSDANGETLLAAIASVTAEGAALLLGKTSDGGALMIRIIDNDVSTPFYPADLPSLNDVLMALVGAANNAQK